MTTILKGNIVSAPACGRLDVTEHGYLIAENGVITGVYPVLSEQYAGASVEDYGDCLIVQSFADLHLHAPQYPMLGMGHGSAPAGLAECLRLPHGGPVCGAGLRPDGVPAAGGGIGVLRDDPGVHVFLPPHRRYPDLDG